MNGVALRLIFLNCILHLIFTLNLSCNLDGSEVSTVHKMHGLLAAIYGMGSESADVLVHLGFEIIAIGRNHTNIALLQGAM